MMLRTPTMLQQRFARLGLLRPRQMVELDVGLLIEFLFRLVST